MVLVGLLGVLAWQKLYRSTSPAAAAADRLGDEDPAARISAIGQLERYGQEEPGVALLALREALKDGSARVRAAAALAMVVVVRAAGMKGSDLREANRAVTAIFETTNDAELDVRASSVQALWMIGALWQGPSGVVDYARLQNVLEGASTDPNQAIRLAGIRGLGAICPELNDDPPATLVAALEDASEEIRVAAVEALSRFTKGLPRLLPTVVRSFEKARPEARAAYAAVFERIRPGIVGDETVLALGSALSSPDDEVRCLAASALRGVGPKAYPAIPALIASAATPRRHPPAVAGPVPFPDPSVAKDFTATPDDERWWRLGPGSSDGKDPALAAARTILRILPIRIFDSGTAARLDPASFARMKDLLNSGPPEIRAAVAYALGRFRPDPAYIPVLGEAIRDPVPTVRAAALKGLHDLADRMEFAPPETVKAALEDESLGVRYWAAGALGHTQLGLDPYIPILIRHAEHDPDAEVRGVCAMEIREMVRRKAVSPAVVPVLTAALGNSSPEVRCAACALLGRLGRDSAPAIPELIRLLTQKPGVQADRSERAATTEQQYRATVALGHIAAGTPAAEQTARLLIEVITTEPPPRASYEVIRLLPEFGPLASGAIPRLREMASSPNQGLRETAQEALTKLTGERE
jgi:HEAT repeat protein